MSASRESSAHRPAVVSERVASEQVASPRFLFQRGAVHALAACALSLLALAACTDESAGGANTAARPGARAEYVDESSCASCHPEEVARWTGTDHDLAMDPANASTVLADFDGTEFVHAGVTTRFAKKDGRYLVTTEGEDGKPTEFQVENVFGVDPLQQYLIPFPGGRQQALSVAWDTHEKRWFHTYGDERIPAGDALHWTKPAQNWNYMCAECHATDLVRGWDDAAQTYRTRAFRYDVGCQACHGPASGHMAWTELHERAPAKAEKEPARGFAIDLDGADSTVEVETCARCHSRRAPLADGYDHAHRLMDDYLPAQLDEGLYRADGQIQDEVYEYGSFLQSPMHARGVRCSDCHDPHGLKQWKPGNQQCVTCHNQDVPAAPPHVDSHALKRREFDSKAHHFHEPGTPGSMCIDCHAPQRTYMQVDPRRDHSFRIPRPDLTLAIGTPNACDKCHADKGTQWSADAIERWYGPDRRKERHYGIAIDAARAGKPGAADGLLALVADKVQPAIVRATALSLLLRYPSQPALAAFGASLADPDPLVRRAAVEGFELLPADARLEQLAGLLKDPVRAVRLECARLLASARPLAHDAVAKALDDALAEYVACQQSLFERPEGHANLGTLRIDQGRTAEAETELRAAIRRDPTFVPAYVNLADVLRERGDELRAEELLRDGLKAVPDGAPLHHVLGLGLLRQERREEALASLSQAADLAPGDSRFAYVHAVALYDLRGPEEGLRAMEAVLKRSPWDRDARLALAGWRAQNGDAAGAQAVLEELRRINPHDPAVADRGR